MGRWKEVIENGEHLFDRIINETLLIPESLYPGYELLFIFDKTTSHCIYPKDVLQVAQMNQGPGGQQLFLQASL